jgi:hypothetical protein
MEDKCKINRVLWACKGSVIIILIMFLSVTISNYILSITKSNFLSLSSLTVGIMIMVIYGEITYKKFKQEMDKVN